MNSMQQENCLYLPAKTRHFEDFGFMQAHLSFKPNLTPERRNFGSLITIDDAVLKPGAKGFGIHSHEDVEVVTFLVDGEVLHVDPNDPSHTGTLRAKGVQIISAGTGILHNEENHSPDKEMRALQIWFVPRKKGLIPNYSKAQLKEENYLDSLRCVLSPDGQDGSLTIQQDAYLSYGNFKGSNTVSYQPKQTDSQSFVYIIDGHVEVLGQKLSKGDGFGFKNNQEFSLNIFESSEFLVFDVTK